MKTKINCYIFAILSCLFLHGGINQANAIPVFDAAAFAQLVLQVTRLKQMYDNLEDQRKWAYQNYIHLGSRGMLQFIDQYKSQFQDIYRSVTDLEHGGLMNRVFKDPKFFNDVYLPYENDPKDPFDDPEEAINNPLVHNAKKQLLITKEQMRYAIQVGGQILETLPKTEEQVNQALMTSRGATGMLQATQAGTQLLGTVALSLEKLVVQLGTLQQAEAAKGMQENEAQAQITKLYDHALDGWGVKPNSANMP